MKSNYRVWFTAALVLVLASLVLSPAAAYAAPPAQTPEPPGLRLLAVEHLLKRQQLALDGLSLRLEFAREVSGEVQTWIDRLKGLGKDTSALETALAAYQTQIDAAQASWNTANGILANPAGFDADGHVTDLEQARLTLRTSGDALIQTHRILADAGRALRRAVQDYRWANHGSA